jgi:tetratricopeptide (TPR) repeat protein
MTLARLAALGCLLLLAADAGAQSLDESKSAFAEGRFLEAAEFAKALETADGYALAAQSLAIHVHYVAPEDEWEELVERAMQMGEEAIRADSTNAQAYYQFAHALGRYAQGVGTITTLRQGLAGKIREQLDAAIALDPYLAEARLALGGWHADIAAEGFIARRMYGGNREAAVVLFEQALGMQPESRVTLFEYAIRLPDLDEEGGEERARELLAKAAQLPIADAYDEVIQELVLEAIATLEGG